MAVEIWKFVETDPDTGEVIHAFRVDWAVPPDEAPEETEKNIRAAGRVAHRLGPDAELPMPGRDRYNKTTKGFERKPQAPAEPSPPANPGPP